MGNNIQINNNNNSNNVTEKDNSTIKMSHNDNSTISNPHRPSPVQGSRSNAKEEIKTNKFSSRWKGGMIRACAVIVGTDPNFQYDAIELKRTLEEKCGYKSYNIKLLLGHQATAENVINSMKVYEKYDNSSFLFYFSGHGVPVDNNTSTLVLPGGENLMYTKLFEALETIISKKKFVILDCCHAAPQMKYKSFDPNTIEDFKHRISEGSGTVFWFSCKANQLALAPKNPQAHSLMTEYILAGLQFKLCNDYCDDCVRYKSVVTADHSLIKLSVLKDFVMTHIKKKSTENSKIGQMVVTELEIDNEFVFGLNFGSDVFNQVF